MADLLQRVRYPGIVGVRSFQYSNQHGASPGRAFISTNPQPNPPAGYGTLAFDDGQRGIALKNCRVASMEARFSKGEKSYFIVLEDERWMWQNAPVRASFNKVQPDGKLSPFTIASPTEIAEYLLSLAGVTNYKLILPAGLNSSIRSRARDYLKPGQNFPITRTNPPCNWDGIPAMQALSELAARFGSRVIYQPAAGGRILVAPVGGPWSAPKAGLIQSSVGIDAPARPRAVTLYGAETMHQCRIPLEPVAEEWDQTYMHIFEVSYAPQVISRLLVLEATSTHPGSSIHRVEIKLPDPAKPSDESRATWFTIVGTTLASLQAAMFNDERLRTHVASVVMVNASTIRMTGVQDRTFAAEFKLSGPGLPPQARCATKIATAPGLRKPGWGYCPPPTFRTVQATDRLAKDEAIRLAAKTVWKTFRIANCAPHLLSKLQEARREKDPKKWPKLDSLKIPGFGDIQFRQQIVPTQEMAERLEPTARQLGGIQVGNTFAAVGRTILPDYYNGRSSARPAVVRGQYSRLGVGNVLWTVDNSTGQKLVNSRPNSRVFVPWNVDIENQLIVFSDYVYKFLPIGNSLLYEDPDLIYEGGVYALDPKTNVPARYMQSLSIPGGFAPAVADIFDDVVVNWIGRYDENNRLTRAVRTDYGDGFKRAKDYHAGMLKPYQTKATGLFSYLGIRKVDCDGAVQQVTWKLDKDDGVFTIVSLNSETSTVIPPWGQRQLQENLPPNRLNKLLNAAENPAGLANAVKEIAKRGLPYGLGNIL